MREREIVCACVCVIERGEIEMHVKCENSKESQVTKLYLYTKEWRDITIFL